MKTLIISDLHLGANNSQTDKIQEILTTDFDRLILNGDTIDNLNFKRFKKHHWLVLEKLSELGSDGRAVLVKGNHDNQTKKGESKNTFDILPKIIGTAFVDETIIEGDFGRYLVLHGDRFDPTLNFPIITDAADWCYQAAQKLNKKTAKWLKKKVKHLGGVIKFVEQQATKYALEKGCNGVITGHTHYHEDREINGVRFINCGSWVETPCHYVKISSEVMLKEF
ncbi:hypothetical protein C4577_02190 [Candidatus Parcubacteria bacterium]|nr:MAG: hypothetical protein C4577_02190 [Candidatus Parcubacteria bacterium]